MGFTLKGKRQASPVLVITTNDKLLFELFRQNLCSSKKPEYATALITQGSPAAFAHTAILLSYLYRALINQQDTIKSK